MNKFEIERTENLPPIGSLKRSSSFSHLIFNVTYRNNEIWTFFEMANFFSLLIEKCSKMRFNKSATKKVFCFSTLIYKRNFFFLGILFCVPEVCLDVALISALIRKLLQCKICESLSSFIKKQTLEIYDADSF